MMKRLNRVVHARRLNPIPVSPIVRTQPLPDDADDPAIWVHPTNPALSLVIGTNKESAPGGGLGVFDLRGRMVQWVGGLDRPNNVDVAYGFRWGGRRIDIAVATERFASRLRIYRIDPMRRRLFDMTDLEEARVFRGEREERAMPMGIALYTHPRTGEIHAIVAPKSGPREGYLHQYRLVNTRAGRVGVQLVRTFGKFSGEQEIEAVAVDNELGYVYYADEQVGIRKYHADPDHPHASRELALFATQFEGDHEGIAVYAPVRGEGYLLCVEQLEENSLIHIYPRFGRQTEPLKVIATGADETDGLDVSAHNFGGAFQSGLVVAMNSSGRNFFYYSWESLANAGTPQLK
ncbi:MAG: phytase [Fimbriimonadales bacterium]